MLFGSRLVSEGTQRFLSSRGSMSGANFLQRQGLVTVSSPLRVTLSRPMLCEGPQLASTTLAVRSYGTRSVWNVARGRKMVFVWFVGFTVWAGSVQDFFGP